MNTKEIDFKNQFSSTIIMPEFKNGVINRASTANEVDQRLFELLIELDVTRNIKNSKINYKSLLQNGISLLVDD